MLLKSQTQMALNAGALVLLCFFVWSLLGTFSESYAQSYVNNSGLCGGPLEEDSKSIDGCFKFLSKVDLKLGLWRLLFYIQLFLFTILILVLC